jgi:hypothetical protein
MTPKQKSSMASMHNSIFPRSKKMQVGDLVKYLNHRTYIPPIKGVWLVINMERNNALLDEGEGKYATLKKGSNTRFAHISHIEKV